MLAPPILDHDDIEFQEVNLKSCTKRIVSISLFYDSKRLICEVTKDLSNSQYFCQKSLFRFICM